MTAPLPDLILYARHRCVLCDEARQAIEMLLADRTAHGLPVPTVVEYDIDIDPDLQRRYFDRIPVIELGSGRLELATSLARLRRLLADILDTPPGRLSGVTHSEIAG